MTDFSSCSSFEELFGDLYSDDSHYDSRDIDSHFDGPENGEEWLGSLVNTEEEPEYSRGKKKEYVHRQLSGLKNQDAASRIAAINKPQKFSVKGESTTNSVRNGGINPNPFDQNYQGPTKSGGNNSSLLDHNYQSNTDVDHTAQINAQTNVLYLPFQAPAQIAHQYSGELQLPTKAPIQNPQQLSGFNLPVQASVQNPQQSNGELHLPVQAPVSTVQQHKGHRHTRRAPIVDFHSLYPHASGSTQQPGPSMNGPISSDVNQQRGSRQEGVDMSSTPQGGDDDDDPSDDGGDGCSSRSSSEDESEDFDALEAEPEFASVEEEVTIMETFMDPSNATVLNEGAKVLEEILGVEHTLMCFSCFHAGHDNKNSPECPSGRIRSFLEGKDSFYSAMEDKEMMKGVMRKDLRRCCDGIRWAIENINKNGANDFGITLAAVRALSRLMEGWNSWSKSDAATAAGFAGFAGDLVRGDGMKVKYDSPSTRFTEISLTRGLEELVGKTKQKTPRKADKEFDADRIGLEVLGLRTGTLCILCHHRGHARNATNLCPYQIVVIATEKAKIKGKTWVKKLPQAAKQVDRLYKLVNGLEKGDERVPPVLAVIQDWEKYTEDNSRRAVCHHLNPGYIDQQQQLQGPPDNNINGDDFQNHDDPTGEFAQMLDPVLRHLGGNAIDNQSQLVQDIQGPATQPLHSPIPQDVASVPLEIYWREKSPLITLGKRPDSFCKQCFHNGHDTRAQCCPVSIVKSALTQSRPAALLITSGWIATLEAAVEWQKQLPDELKQDPQELVSLIAKIHELKSSPESGSNLAQVAKKRRKKGTGPPAKKPKICVSRMPLETPPPTPIIGQQIFQQPYKSRGNFQPQKMGQQLHEHQSSFQVQKIAQQPYGSSNNAQNPPAQQQMCPGTPAAEGVQIDFQRMPPRLIAQVAPFIIQSVGTDADGQDRVMVDIQRAPVRLAIQMAPFILEEEDQSDQQTPSFGQNMEAVQSNNWSTSSSSFQNQNQFAPQNAQPAFQYQQQQQMYQEALPAQNQYNQQKQQYSAPPPPCLQGQYGQQQHYGSQSSIASPQINFLQQTFSPAGPALSIAHPVAGAAATSRKRKQAP